MKTIEITGTIREELGKKSSNKLRKEDLVPCVLYGEKQNIHFATSVKSFKDIIYTPEFHKVSISVGDETYEAILKDAQFHPVTDEILHADFLMLVPGKKITTQIPLKFVGLAAGVKQGGKLVPKVRKVSVRVSAENLVEHIDVNIDALELGKSIRVRDIELDTVEILNSPGIPIASCEIPRALRSAESEAEEEAEAEEGAAQEESEETAE